MSLDLWKKFDEYQCNSDQLIPMGPIECFVIMLDVVPCAVLRPPGSNNRRIYLAEHDVPTQNGKSEWSFVGNFVSDCGDDEMAEKQCSDG
eukprot:4390850-Ditylum_brightwellii.AAC.1